jgi:hypothetical protein
MTGTWATIPGFENYEITECGRVRRRLPSNRWPVGKELTPSRKRNGYWAFTLKQDGVCRTVSVHRLVAITYISPPPSPQHQVAHWDGDKGNNHVSNLRWATPSENKRDSIRHGTIAAGERSGATALTAEQVIAIRQAKRAGVRTPVIAKQYGIGKNTVNRIYKGQAWKHLVTGLEAPQDKRIGEDNYNAKLTVANVIEIRRLYAEGWSKKGLARRYGVKDTTITGAVSGRTWKHVGDAHA